MPHSRPLTVTSAAPLAPAAPQPLPSLLAANPIRWTSENEWVLPAVQERSRNSLRRIMIAAAELFITRGYDETTVAEIGRRAGVGVGTIYKRFADKRAILSAVLDAYRDTRAAEIDAMCAAEKWRGRSAEDIVALHIEIILSSVVHDEGILRLVERLRITEPDVAAALIDWNSEVSDRITRLLLPEKARLAHEDVGAAVLFLHNLIRGSLIWAMLPRQVPPGQPLIAADPAVKQNAYRTALAYLGLAA